jgi:hypothetical protein
MRRAQLKGPYQLLGRNSQQGDAWKKFERERLAKRPTGNTHFQIFLSPLLQDIRDANANCSSAIPSSIHRTQTTKQTRICNQLCPIAHELHR